MAGSRRGPAPGKAAAEEKAPSFEEALQGLNDIVEKLEGGDLTLDEALQAFEEGVRLARECSLRLEEAERRIEFIREGKDGQPILEEVQVDTTTRSQAVGSERENQPQSGGDDRRPR